MRKSLFPNYEKVRRYVETYDDLVVTRLGGRLDAQQQTVFDNLLTALWSDLSEEERTLATMGKVS